MGEKSYPVLELTDRGYKVMTGREAIRLSQILAEKKSPSAEQAGLQESEKETFCRLRELRTSLARQEKLPPYCIFQDRTLREMARNLPATPDELLDIVGVGEVTLRKYGMAFLELLNQIRHEK